VESGEWKVVSGEWKRESGKGKVVNDQRLVTVNR